MHHGWRAEVYLAAEDWTKAAARSLDTGFLLVIDYGHDEAELYGGSHATGTLTAFKGHTSSAAPPFQDITRDPIITSHVDLTGVTRPRA
jgi:SAM-dependent MidA family methyltransferase